MPFFLALVCAASAAAGETLYNGIRLPDDWPPRTVRADDAEPMRAPYLEPTNLPSAIPINVGRQLFVDDFLVERLDGITRIYPKPVKYAGNPVLRPETDLERNLGDRNACAVPKGGGIWWDPEARQFKLWYEAGWINTVCLATSTNGIDWIRPKLNVVRGTNQVLPTDLLPDSWTVVPDFDNPDRSQRWKMFLRGPGMDLPGYALASPDGIHWNTRRLTGLSLDRSSLMWNPFRRKWIFSIRSVWNYGGGIKRTRNYFETDDFLNGCLYEFNREENTRDMVLWCRTDRLDLPDPVTKFDPPQLYSVDGVAYESLMLGMFEIHHGPENHICMKEGLPKITDLCFAYSRDGFHWTRPDRTAAIRSERWGSDRWDTGYVQAAANLCVIRDEKLWFCYGAFRGDAKRRSSSWYKNGMYHDGATGVAVLRRDGFVGLKAEARGSVTTRPVTFDGCHLFVNADLAAGGSLAVDVLGSDGTVLGSSLKPVTGDSTKVEVALAPSLLAGLKGRPVRFRFSFDRGTLYAFWVSAGARGESRGYVAGGGPDYPSLRDEPPAASARAVGTETSASRAERLLNVDDAVPVGVYREFETFRGLKPVTAQTPQPGDIVPLRIAHPLARILIGKGLTNLHNVPADRDAWEITPRDGITWIVGSNPRAVMNGVWEYLTTPRSEEPRIGAIPLKVRVHTGTQGGLFGTRDGKENVRNLVRRLSYFGASHVAPVCDWTGPAMKSMFNYVGSDIYPHAASSNARGTPKERAGNRQRLRDMIDCAKEYGLGVLFETILMPVGEGPTPAARRTFLEERFEPSAVGWCGTYQSYCLCISHPKVRAFLEDAVTRFMREFPEIDMIHYITMDASGDFCERGKCARCGQKTKSDLQREATELVLAAARKVRPDIVVINDGFDWVRRSNCGEAFTDRQTNFCAQVGYALSATCDPASYDRQLHASLLHARAVTAGKGQLFVGRDSFFQFDDLISFGRAIDDYPLTMREKATRWLTLGADGYLSVRGMRGPVAPQLNGHFLRAALTHPYEDEMPFARRTAAELFGPRAGAALFEAWRIQRQAHRILSNGFSYPSASVISQYHPWCPAWHDTPVPAAFKPPKQDHPRYFKLGVPFSPFWCDREELAPAAANGWTYHPSDFTANVRLAGDTMNAAAALYAQALGRVRAAEAALRADVAPRRPDYLKALFSPDVRFEPSDYLRRFAFSLELNGILYGAAGDYFVLRATGARNGLGAADYRNLGRENLRRLATTLEALVALLKREEGRMHDGCGRKFDLAAIAANAAALRKFLAAERLP